MRNHIAMLLLLGACASDTTTPTTSDQPKTSGHIPAAGFGFAAGPVAISGPAIPGNATLTNAILGDEDTDPSSAYGTGDYDVTLDTGGYSGSLSSVGLSYAEGADRYLVLGGFNIYKDAAQHDRLDQVVVIVKESDFAVGATVQFDGEDRIALFGNGDPYADEPEITAAAFTGSVTFTAGQLGVGNTISATLHGDFAVIDSVPPPAESQLVGGDYTLEYQEPAKVYCEGTLTGHEADFEGITAASVGLVGGDVTVAVASSESASVSGAAITSGFGTSSLDLSPVDTGYLGGFSSSSGSGPDGTTHVGNYLALDAADATTDYVYGSAGAMFETAARDGECGVAFGALLTH